MADDQMADVVELRPPLYDGLVCPCGSAWWHACGIAVDTDGRVHSHTVPLWCRECGTVAPTADAPHAARSDAQTGEHDRQRLACHWQPSQAVRPAHSGGERG